MLKDFLPSSADVRRAIVARGLRAIGDGFVSIILPAYLLALGHDAVEIGALMTATLTGSALFTLFAGFAAARFGLKRSLLAASLLMIATGIGLAVLSDFWPLLIVAFIGTLNPSSGDVSVFLPLEQSLLAHTVEEKNRTAVFASYSLAGSLMAALGTLVAAVPDLASRWLGIAPLAAMQGLFLLYAGFGVAAALLYRGLSRKGDRVTEERTQPLKQSRGIVYRLAALFSVDAFGGGFIVQSILALWLFQAFHLPVAVAASIFFWTSLLTAVSYLAAVPIARRFGLVNTMVFTHLPANFCLVAIPFVKSLPVVIGLLAMRSLLSQMDVPTRTSFVMSVVTPAERPAAASVTSVPRSLAAAISPTIAGYLLSLSSFAWPLLIGGALKIVYDLTLLAMFRNVQPAKEPAGRPAQ
jgi:MFS family permease